MGRRKVNMGLGKITNGVFLKYLRNIFIIIFYIYLTRRVLSNFYFVFGTFY